MIKHCKQIDFVFDLVNSIKSLQRQRRAADESLITHIDQELPSAHQRNKQPSEFTKFWALTDKISVQQLFITWITETCKGNVPVYLGGCNVDDKNSCLKIVHGTFSAVQSLESF